MDVSRAFRQPDRVGRDTIRVQKDSAVFGNDFRHAGKAILEKVAGVQTTE